MTAAHCTVFLDERDEKYLWWNFDNVSLSHRTSRVRAGVLNLRKLGSVERRILRKIEHPEYKNPQVYFDIALIVLDQGIIMKLSITK